MEVRGQCHAPAALYPQERPGTHCTEGWVGPRAGLDRCGKSRPHRDSTPRPSPDRPARSQSLYRLRYPAHRLCIHTWRHKQPPETQYIPLNRKIKVLQSRSVCICSCSCNDMHFVLRLPPVPVATRSKARVCGRSLAGIGGSDPAGGMVVCL